MLAPGADGPAADHEVCSDLSQAVPCDLNSRIRSRSTRSPPPI